MIKAGEMTIIMSRGQPKTYICIRIENNNAVLRDITTEGAGGKYKVIPVKECPYVVDGNIITPEVKTQPKIKTTLNITKLIKKNTDLQISNSARYFFAEWLETALLNLLANAEENALNRRDKRITAAHIHWLETNTSPNGYWPENEEYMKE
tara:strand:- start:1963 stop:2415 length:453 start_codon:yes stop_codon:yes gene_type:complete